MGNRLPGILSRPHTEGRPSLAGRSDLGKFADHVADIDEECRKTGRVTDEAVKLIDAHGNEDRLVLYRRLFGREPTS